MKILITGSAGFIASQIVLALLKKGCEIIGLDNINNYYDTELKYARLQEVGISKNTIVWYKYVESLKYPNYRFIRMNLEDKQAMQMLFSNEKFDVVCNLAAQAGVRYSIENPDTYIHSNVEGFLNILEGCRWNKVKHLIYASSSSIYGLNANLPFSEGESTVHPVSLYAASKKSNELMAHAYSHLYSIPTTGLRFFTVYGPWGRPDMSPFLFLDAMLHNQPIKVFNNGNMLRDFTNIDDIVEGVIKVIDHVPLPNKDWDPQNPDPGTSSAPYRIYNIGNSHPIKLMDFIQTIEDVIGKKAKKIYLPMQPGDVYQTSADISRLQADLGFKPHKTLTEGVKETVEWYCGYYNL